MSLYTTVSNKSKKIFAFSVVSGFILLGMGFYHGEFHSNSRTLHCHTEGVCHQH